MAALLKRINVHATTALGKIRREQEEVRKMLAERKAAQGGGSQVEQLVTSSSPGVIDVVDNDIPGPTESEDPLANIREALAGPAGQASGLRIEPEKHVTKARRGITQRIVSSTEGPTVDQPDDGRRRSGRAAVQASAGRYATTDGPMLTVGELPKDKDFTMVRLLVNEQLEEPGEILQEEQVGYLRRWWEFAVAKEKDVDRFLAWLRGKSTKGCLFCQLVKHSSTSNWANGKDFACEDCVLREWPCCRVSVDLDLKQVTVVVLPESGKADVAESFKYWTEYIPRKRGGAR